MSSSVLPMFSSKSFLVSGLIFRSLIHLKFTFVYGVRKCYNFILLHVAVQFPQHHLLKRLSSSFYILASFVKNKVPICDGFISGLSLLFHQSIFLFLCQYHTVLMTVALQYVISQQSEWPSSKNLQTINAGEGVEKKKLSCTVSGNIN